MNYEPTMKSLARHKIPDWYSNAKLGIMIHWGLYSVPAWAETGDINELIANLGHGPHLYSNPYAEWYNNTYLLDSSAREHHNKNYSSKVRYKDFQKDFQESAVKFNSDEWAEFFNRVGARYVVMVAKHHDGYCLWPTDIENPITKKYYSERDFIGELNFSVRQYGLKMGIYYSGVLDWSVLHYPISDSYTMGKNFQHSDDYIDYAVKQYRELIDRYEPDLLWNDIGFPRGYNIKELLAYYYNRIEDGLVNDRWTQYFIPKTRLLQPLVRLVCDRIDKKTNYVEEEIVDKKKYWYDYRTTEYRSLDGIMDHKWETIRGIGGSFGYNINESDLNMMSGVDLIKLLVDVVSKNGNLLINIGPDREGQIPDMQKEPLILLGQWLEIYGDAIYDTTVHNVYGDISDEGIEYRYTRKGSSIYIIPLTPFNGSICITDFDNKIEEIIGLGDMEVEHWRLDNNMLQMSIRNSNYKFCGIGAIEVKTNNVGV